MRATGHTSSGSVLALISAREIEDRRRWIFEMRREKGGGYEGNLRGQNFSKNKKLEYRDERDGAKISRNGTC